jgi:hypothetical protein
MAAKTNQARDEAASAFRYVSDSTYPRKKSTPDARQAAKLSAASSPYSHPCIEVLLAPNW